MWLHNFKADFDGVPQTEDGSREVSYLPRMSSRTGFGSVHLGLNWEAIHESILLVSDFIEGFIDLVSLRLIRREIDDNKLPPSPAADDLSEYAPCTAAIRFSTLLMDAEVASLDHHLLCSYRESHPIID
ncbi:hypothetical protein TNCV_731191 [Trichonephila clavipes]|nr:hypothetical protein TNCV_731191 [Trichonephila clavipes]